MLKSNLILVFSLTMFFLVSFANAGVQKLAVITNQEDQSTIDLQIITDDNEDVTHLRLKFKDEDGKVTETDKYTADTAAAGIVLYKVDKRDVVKLKSDNFSPYNGGEIELNFLYNGITGSRGIKKLDLSRDGDKWQLEDEHKKVKKLHFVSNKKALIGTIGIKRIETK